MEAPKKGSRDDKLCIVYGLRLDFANDAHSKFLFFFGFSHNCETTTAFTSSPNAAFVSTSVSTGSGSFSHPLPCRSGCNCGACGTRTVLRMAEEEAAEVPNEEAAEVTTEAAVEVPTEEAAEVPVEVNAMDGVASEEEAHNTERPARDSGIKKHKKGKSPGTPLADLEIGSFVDGTVKTITTYGAFVDIGVKTDALLHVSRLSDSFVSNVEDVVKAGDSVNVRIVSVDSEKGQVAISMLSEEAEQEAANSRRGSGGKRKDRPQRSQGDRGAQIATLNALVEKGFDNAKFVEGEVVSALAFGAFVRFSVNELAEGVEGELDGLVYLCSSSWTYQRSRRCCLNWRQGTSTC